MYPQGNPPTEELIQCTEAIWAADQNSFPDSEIDYNLAGPEYVQYQFEMF